MQEPEPLEINSGAEAGAAWEKSGAVAAWKKIGTAKKYAATQFPALQKNVI